MEKGRRGEESGAQGERVRGRGGRKMKRNGNEDEKVRVRGENSAREGKKVEEMGEEEKS